MLKVASLSSILTAAISWLAMLSQAKTAQIQPPISMFDPNLTSIQILESILSHHRTHSHAHAHHRRTERNSNHISTRTFHELALGSLQSNPSDKDYLSRHHDTLDPLPSGEGTTIAPANDLAKHFYHLNGEPRPAESNSRIGRHHKREATTTVASSKSPQPTPPPPPSPTTTINYSLLMVNGTDPFSISAESRPFSLPTEIQVTFELVCVRLFVFFFILKKPPSNQPSIPFARNRIRPKLEQILMCLFYGTLAFTAIASNMIVCYIVLSNQRMRTATNYFIVNLAVGDILMALLCIPFTFPANLIFQSWPFGLSLCVIVSYSQANSVFIR